MKNSNTTYNNQLKHPISNIQHPTSNEYNRHNWTKEEIAKIYHTPLLELIFNASEIHRKFQEPNTIYLNTLISVKTGGCTEDCAYCAQSAHYKTDVKPNTLSPEEVIQCAKKAKSVGVNRVCLSISGYEADNELFENILTITKKIKMLGMEVCCTLGKITKERARKLLEAGISAYNHNLDTSEGFYPNIVTTHSYKERLNTLRIIQEVGIPYCCGGIIGMGETVADRISLLHTLATMKVHPYNFPINAIVPIPQTPLENQTPVPLYDIIRMIATARIIMPKTLIAFAAGRINFSEAEQALCFLVGANSIFIGEKLLTTPNNDIMRDKEMLKNLGLKPATNYGVF